MKIARAFLGICGVAAILGACGGDSTEDKERELTGSNDPCASTDAGKSRCKDNLVQGCTGSLWVTAQTCAAPTTCAMVSNVATCTTGGEDACTLGSTRCQGNKVEACANNIWVAGLDCSTAGLTCQLVSGVATCTTSNSTSCTTPGAMRCNDNNVEACTGGAWTLAASCTTFGLTCQQDGTTATCGTLTPTCTSGHKRCNSLKIETCSGGGWIETTDCASAGSCNELSDTHAICGDPCVNGTSRCSDSKLQDCVNSEWADAQDCSPSACVETSSTEAACQQAQTCTDGHRKCEGPNIRVCNDGNWDFVSTCEEGTACTVLSATSVSCQPTGPCTTGGTSGYTVCDGNTEVFCEGYVQQGEQSCSALAGVCHNYGGGVASCLFQGGEQCAFEVEGGDLLVFPCGSVTAPSASMGCDIDEGCVSATTTCTPATPFVRSCDGDRLVIGCVTLNTTHTPAFVNCAAEEYGAGTCSGVSCVVGTGRACNNTSIVCESGLSCEDIDPTSGWGTCGGARKGAAKIPHLPQILE